MNGMNGIQKGWFKRVPKEWGTEYWYVNTPHYCMKILVLRPGCSGSLHYHKVKDETFLIVQGGCHLELEGEKLWLEKHSQLRIMPLARHRFSLPAIHESCVIMEISTHHDDEDTYRLEPSKGFEKKTEDLHAAAG